jgi:exosortase J
MAEDLQLVSPPTASAAAELESRAPQRLGLLLGCGIAVLVAVGCLGIYRELALLWIAWTTDPLRSVGMLIPPVSIVLTLRVWRQCGWQMRGTWWGLGVIGLAYVLSVLHQKIVFFAVLGGVFASLIPTSLPLFVYGSGIILLFAGFEVWRKAWFPIGLLLLSQPVPVLTTDLIDIPLQSISARVARSFATLIHFAPSTPQLRLMFSPDFGMFIAPGCDGIRGAVTMGYVALILGYLKRVRPYIWAAYVAGAVLLGYLFNFIRLCVLVLYYRVALGHPDLEGVAKQADYVIGSCLFLIATLLFFWLASRKQKSAVIASAAPASPARSLSARSVAFRCAAFVVTLLAFLSLPSSRLNSTYASKFDQASFAARMPKQIGSFSLTRTWYEQQSGVPLVQAGAYSSPGSDEIILAVSIAPKTYFHDSNSCWLARGLSPDLLTEQPFVVAGGESIHMSTGFYSDGVIQSIVVDTVCTPQTCTQYQGISFGKRLGFVFLDQQLGTNTSPGQHPVSMMVRIDRLHTNEPKDAVQQALQSEAQKFLSGLDPTNLSHAFQ